MSRKHRITTRFNDDEIERVEKDMKKRKIKKKGTFLRKKALDELST